MIIGINDHDKYLYHYTSTETAINFILKDHTLRFSPYTGTNDPKESKNWVFDVGTNENRDLGIYNSAELSEWLSKELKQNTRLICFSRDTPHLTGNHLADIFSRGFCKPRMWAQYANRHTGVCLVFNKQALHEKITSQIGTTRDVMSGAVKYIDRGIVKDLWKDQEYLINVDELEHRGKTQYAIDHLQTHYKKLFFEKMTDWKDEIEWRWVVLCDSDEPLYLSFGGALSGIVFGEDTNKEDKFKIVKLTKGQIFYQSLKWKNCSPWYDFGRQDY
ncbi:MULTISPECIES: DUF2971 domain-containing protein [Pseudomonas]|uniref:DUF2971 domain-containing protein n=2 Tax=Pseudomonas TaxID=286 RepID=A0A0W0HSI1_PSEFL|nr:MULTISPECIES: DUF2971 domain-containing protein [Pseudomonas]KTB63867.1 hypothetical protein AO063_03060 [Pseudomonas fluorescens ICMP 11288]RMQ85466.1 hypothetical protein ALP97_04492 [Pseudomonas salomonii]